MSAFRPLPPRPSLEYEHKEAKALLRRLHAGDPESVARATARLSEVGDPASLQLSDAQLILAREYGFASWPKLVRYFTDLETVRELLDQNRDNADYRYIARLFGLSVDAIVAQATVRPERQPILPQAFLDALHFAGDDAFQLGQTEIRPENLCYGLLRHGRHVLPFLTTAIKMDTERFRGDVLERVRPEEPSPSRPKLQIAADAQEAINAAIAAAATKQREAVQLHHLLYALTRWTEGPVADILARYGTTAAIVNTQLEQHWL